MNYFTRTPISFLIATVIFCAFFSSLSVAQILLPTPIKESAIVSSHIDKRVKESIVRLSTGTRQQRLIAHYLTDNVKYSLISGTLPIDHKVIALSGWWIGKYPYELLDSQSARDWKKTAGLKPIITIHMEVINQPNVLVDTFLDCEFREVEVIVKRQIGDPLISCVEEDSAVSIVSAKTDMTIFEPCRANVLGVCHFALPPAIYMFNVTCDNDPTSPGRIFRNTKAGNDVQREPFNNVYWVEQTWEKYKTIE